MFWMRNIFGIFVLILHPFSYKPETSGMPGFMSDFVTTVVIFPQHYYS